VKTTRDLLEILIGRVGYLESSAIAFEIAGALKDISFAVDTFAVSLLPKIPSREECSKQQRQDIDRTLAETIKVYQQTDFGDPWKESV
jgi:hypothetical protein